MARVKLDYKELIQVKSSLKATSENLWRDFNTLTGHAAVERKIKIDNIDAILAKFDKAIRRTSI